MTGDSNAQARARHARLSQLVAAARRLSDVERTAYLQHECDDDAELRAEVEALLAELTDDGLTDGIAHAVGQAAAGVVRDEAVTASHLEHPAAAGGASPSSITLGRADPDSGASRPLHADAADSDSGTSQPRSGWLYGGVVIGVVGLALFLFQGITIVLHGHTQEKAGWRGERVADGLVVASVDADGVAAGRLEVGDRILAIDGDSRVARTGERYKIRDWPVGRRYTVRSERAGIVREHELELAATPLHRSKRIGGLFELVTAFGLFAMAVFVIVVKPDDGTVRVLCVTALLASLQGLGIASHPVLALPGFAPQRFLQWLLLSGYPLVFIGIYFFFARFPVRVASGARWQVLGGLVTAAGVALWLPSAARYAVEIQGPERAYELIARHLGLFDAFYSVVIAATGGYVVFALVATAAIMLRNFRRLPNEDARRRVRLVLCGAAVPVAARILRIAVEQGVAGLAFTQSASYQLVVAGVNSLQLVFLGTLAYAIVKHRVLGIALIIRAGLQHLLARGSLRVLLALPLLLILVSIVSNPDQTVAELLTSGATGRKLLLIGVAGLALRYRDPILTGLDRRFFREAYDQDRILVGLVESIRERDSVEELLPLVSRRIDTALHVERLSLFYCDEGSTAPSASYSPDDKAEGGRLPAGSRIVSAIAAAGTALTARELRRIVPRSDRAWLDSRDIELVVPVLGVDRMPRGVIALGPKRSAEPYTDRDVDLLQAIGAQLGAACEVVSLRERVHSERAVQREVLDGLGHRRDKLLRECPNCGRCYDGSSSHCVDDGRELCLTLPVERLIDGKYRLERLLGRGGMGAVYEASDLNLGRRVAIKVMRGSSFGSASAQRRFAREARVSARLAHPGIVRLYDFGQLRGAGAYLVLELIDGVTLHDELKRRERLPPDETAAVVDGLMEALAAAHEANVLHRDLKPANVLLVRSAQGDLAVKLLDFGLAKIREEGFADPKSETQAGILMGTPSYMSPEQLRGEPVDVRSDLYSLGIIALEALTGRPQQPLNRDQRPIEVSLAERLGGGADDPQRERLATVFGRCLAIDREQRYASVAQARTALVPALREIPG